MSLFARKPISELIAESHTDTLRRTLGPFSLTTLGVGAIIGAGIFVITGTAAAQFAGPALVLSMIFAGIGCAFAGLCYAEFASMIPVAGSAYTYAYATLGELFAWIIGWDLILEYALGASTIAVGWSGNFISILQDMGIHFPAALSGPPGALVALPDGSTVAGVFNLPASVIVLLVSIILIIGIEESAGFNTGIVVVKVVVLAVVRRVRHALHQHGELASVHSAQHRQLRRVRMERRAARRRRDLLRLHRIRRRLHRGARSARTRSATCRAASCGRSSSARSSTSPSRSCSPASCTTRSSTCRRPIALGVDSTGTDVAAADHQARRDRRPLEHDARDAARPAAHLLLDEPRRTAAAGVRQGASALQDAVRHDGHHRHASSRSSPDSFRSRRSRS